MYTDKEIEAMALKGWLEKQGTGFLKMYKDRYWTVIDNGRTLTHYKDEKESQNVHHCTDQISISSIRKIELGDKPEKFHLIMDDTIYNLKAKTHDEQQKWAKGLEALIPHAKMTEVQLADQLKSEMFKVETKAADNLMSAAKNLTFAADTAKKILSDKDLGTAVKATKKIEESVKSLITDDSDFDQEAFLKKKQYYSYFQNIPEKSRVSRLLVGYMEQEKEQKIQQRKTIMLISQKPVLSNLEAEDDEETLSDAVLPPGISFNVLYFFRDDASDEKPEFSIAVKDILGITVKSKKTEEHIYRWVIDLGDSKTFLRTKSLSLRDKWLFALRLALKTAREVTQSKTLGLRNINRIRRVFDQAAETQDPKLIENLIDEHYKKCGGAQLTKTLKENDLTEFICVSKRISKEYIEVLNACCAMKKKRIDIIQEYAKQFQDALMKNWTEFFTNTQIFDICVLFDEYMRDLRLFGENFVDTRLSDAIFILARRLGHKLLKANLHEVNNILKAELEQKPQLNLSLKLFTCGPKKLWAITQEIFDFRQRCNVPDFIREMLTTCDEIVNYYQTVVVWILNNIELPMEYYFTFCNTMEDHDRKCDAFVDLVKKITFFQDTEIANYFGKKTIKEHNKEFATICLTKLVDIWFEYFSAEFMKPVTSIDVDKILADLAKVIKDALPKLRDDHARSLWTNCFQQMTYYFFKSVLETHKVEEGAILVSDLIAKIDEDWNKIVKFFQSGKADNQMIKNNSETIANFKNFLSCSSVMLSVTFQPIKKEFPEEVTAEVLSDFIDMRSDLIGQEKKAARQAIKELLDIIDRNRSTEESKTEAPRLGRSEILRSLRKNHSGATTLNQGKKMSIPRKVTNIASFVMIENENDEIEGYLELYKDQFGGIAIFDAVTWKSHLFSIKNLHLYIYNEHKLHKAELKIGLEFFQSCEKVKEREFKIEFTNGDNMVLRAKDAKEMTKWMNAIHANKAKALMPTTNVLLKLVLYKDAKPIIKDEEVFPEMAFDTKIIKRNPYQLEEDIALIEDIIDPTLKDRKKLKKTETAMAGGHMINLSIAETGSENLQNINEIENQEPDCCGGLFKCFGSGLRGKNTDYQQL